MRLFRISLLVLLSCAAMSVQASNFSTKSFSSPENFEGLGKTEKVCRLVINLTASKRFRKKMDIR